MKKSNERLIDTIDGNVMCRLAYDIDTNSNYVEFYIHNGCDEEIFPYDYAGESNAILCDFDEMTEDELEDLYYETMSEQ